MSNLIGLLQAAISLGTVIMFGCLGEILTEKAGNLNLGVPGIMYLGGIGGITGAFLYELSTDTPSAILGMIVALLSSLLASALAGLLYSFMTTTLRANQNVTGLALTILGGGLANFLGASLNSLSGGVGQLAVATTSSAFCANLPFTRTIGGFVQLIFGQGFLVYVAIILAVVSQWFLNRTRAGLNLRAIGENLATADAAGINVTRHKYLATTIGAMISGLGGLYYVMNYTYGTWSNDGTIESLGWLAVALVIFTTWRPKNAIWGAYLFGFLYWLYSYIGAFLPGLPGYSKDLFMMLPYVVTIIVLIIISSRKKKENQPPESLGLPYFREER